MSALVIYFSHMGHTDIIAERICERTGVERVRIVPKIPYPTSLDALEKRARTEVSCRLLPMLEESGSSIDRYGYIFLGYPIWYGKPAPPVMTYINKREWRGKTVFPFLTFGGTFGRGISELVNVMNRKGAVVKNEILLHFPYEEQATAGLISANVAATDKWLDGIIRKYGTGIIR